MLINWLGNEVIFSFCLFYKIFFYYFFCIFVIFVIYNGVIRLLFEKKVYSVLVDKYWILCIYIYILMCVVLWDINLYMNISIVLFILLLKFLYCIWGVVKVFFILVNIMEMVDVMYLVIGVFFVIINVLVFFILKRSILFFF